MIIEVDKKNRIAVEENCFTLQRLREKKDGREEWESCKWYTNLVTLAKDIIHSRLAGQKTTVNLVEFLKEYQDEVRQFTSLIKKPMYETG